MKELEGVFYYDESSPSCLRWNVNIYYKNQFETEIVVPKIIKGDVAGSLKEKENRWTVKYEQKVYKAHRVVYNLHYNDLTNDLVIDHIDGDASNNKIENLRAVTSKINGRNTLKRKDNKTDVTGVSYTEVNNSQYYSANWTELSGKGRNKYFSIKKLGEELAFFMACEYREQQINLLNLQGAGYTIRHGKN